MNITPNVSNILVKKIPLEEESNGILLNNESDAFLACGEVVQTTSTSFNRTTNSQFVVFNEGAKVYYPKSKGFDTHDKDYQIVNVSDILYSEF